MHESTRVLGLVCMSATVIVFLLLAGAALGWWTL